MKLLGLIGGTGWISTHEYYRGLNEAVNRRLGGHEAARMVLWSFNFGDILRAKEGDPSQKEVRRMVVEAAGRLAAVGAEGILLCANTLHWFAEDVERILPVVHIARATAVRVRQAGLSGVGLLGTLPTMEQDFYRRHLEDAGLRVLVPGPEDRTFIHNAIFDELTRGVFKDATRARFLAIIEALHRQGAQGIILGCTEIPLLVKPGDCAVPLFDTLDIHVEAGADFALS